eukprot:gene488-495_t
MTPGRANGKRFSNFPKGGLPVIAPPEGRGLPHPLFTLEGALWLKHSNKEVFSETAVRNLIIKRKQLKMLHSTSGIYLLAASASTNLVQGLKVGSVQDVVASRPLGGISDAPFTLPTGVWEGYIGNPDFGFAPPEPPYLAVLEITEDSFNPWGVVGSISYGIGDAMYAPVFGFWQMECVPYMAGEFPNGQCFQVTESFREPTSVGDPDAGWYNPGDG